MRVLLVDDEPLARKLLRELLAGIAGIEIAGEAASGPDAVEQIRGLQPDLVFLDVQLPALDGFAVLEKAGPSLPAVIFVTAYDDYAVRAFDADALDYLLKPFDAERLARAVERAHARMASHDSAHILQAVRRLAERSEAPEAPRRIPVHVGGAVRFVEPATIDWIEADGKMVRLHRGKEQLATRQALGDLEELTGPGFLRVHRSALVNVAAITEVQPWFHGDYVIVLRSGAKVRTGRAYRDAVKRIITTGG